MYVSMYFIVSNLSLHLLCVCIMFGMTERVCDGRSHVMYSTLCLLCSGVVDDAAMRRVFELAAKVPNSSLFIAVCWPPRNLFLLFLLQVIAISVHSFFHCHGLLIGRTSLRKCYVLINVESSHIHTYIHTYLPTLFVHMKCEVFHVCYSSGEQGGSRRRRRRRS